MNRDMQLDLLALVGVLGFIFFGFKFLTVMLD
jgi:hypothetical protein